MGENGGLTLLCVNHATQATYRKRELTVMMAVVAGGMGVGPLGSESVSVSK